MSPAPMDTPAPTDGPEPTTTPVASVDPSCLQVTSDVPYTQNVGTLPVGVVVPVGSIGWRGATDRFFLGRTTCNPETAESPWFEGALVGHVYTDSCQWKSSEIEVPTAFKAAEALAKQTGHDTSEPTETHIGAFRATRIDVSLGPVIDLVGCDEGKLMLWPGHQFVPTINQQVYVAEVDGTTLVISVSYDPSKVTSSTSRRSTRSSPRSASTCSRDYAPGVDEQASFETRAVLAPRRNRASRLVLLAAPVAFAAIALLGVGGPHAERAIADVVRPTTAAVPKSPRPPHPAQVLRPGGSAARCPRPAGARSRSRARGRRLVRHDLHHRLSTASGALPRRRPAIPPWRWGQACVLRALRGPVCLRARPGSTAPDERATRWSA